VNVKGSGIMSHGGCRGGFTTRVCGSANGKLGIYGAHRITTEGIPRAGGSSMASFVFVHASQTSTRMIVFKILVGI
jgi:hypothetical protein